MKSINTQYLPELDHLRFFAAIMIVFFHLGNGDIVRSLHLDIGVPLFFTLSGFLFFTIANNSDREIIYWKFIYNRFLRIYPMIIFLFFISIVLMKKFTAIDFINLFGLNYPGNGVTSWIAGDWGYKYLSFNWWTVGIEFTFYLIFPFLYKFYKEIGVKYLVKVLFLILIFRYGFYYLFLEEYGWKNLAINLNYSVFGNFDIFIVGMIAGHWFRTLEHNKYLTFIFSSKILFLIYISLMWWFLINYINNFDPTSYPLFVSTFCAILIVFYSMAFRDLRHKYVSIALAKLGELSFSIYLLHSFVRDVMVGCGIDKHIHSFFTKYIISSEAGSIFAQILIIYVPVIIAISSLTYHTIEKPFLNMRVKYFK